MHIQWTGVIYSVVLTRQSNLPCNSKHFPSIGWKHWPDTR